MQNLTQCMQKGKALVAYLTVGDGGIQRTVEAALALVRGGVNVLELGMPFSDPVADGPVIQAAMQRALDCDTTLETMLAVAKQIRQQSQVPLVFFSYLNPLVQAGIEDTLARMQQAGYDALLLVDCPDEESAGLRALCKKIHLGWIGLIAPSTPAARITKIAQGASGFLYYACRSTTTGVQEGLPQNLIAQLALIKAQTQLPVVVGFGLSTSTQIEQIHAYAEGAVVGSYFVQAVAEGKDATELTAMATQLLTRETKHDFSPEARYSN